MFCRNIDWVWNGTGFNGIRLCGMCSVLFPDIESRFERIFFNCTIVIKMQRFSYVDVTSDRIGLAITQSLSLTGILQYGVIQSK